MGKGRRYRLALLCLGFFLRGVVGLREGGTSSVKCQVSKAYKRKKERRRRLTTPNILLISKDQQQRVLHLAVLDDALEFVLGLVHAVAVIAVDDEDEALYQERKRKEMRQPYPLLVPR